MPHAMIEEGFAVFLHDGEKAVGAVREIRPQSAGTIIIYIENAGDFAVPLSAIQDVHSQKVILDRAKLEPALLHAVAVAHSSEDPRI